MLHGVPSIAWGWGVHPSAEVSGWRASRLYTDDNR